MRRALAAFAVLLIVAGGITWAIASPYQGFDREVFVDIPRGTSTSGAAARLAEAGVLRQSSLLRLARVFRSSGSIQAGEYRFDKPASPFDVLNRLVRGDVYYVELSVPEGSNMFDIAGRLDSLRLIAGSDFLTAARDAALIRDLAPTATTLEGFLYPSTYRLDHHTTAADLCRDMVASFRKEWAKLGNPSNAAATVTLASIVEKETAAPSERATIAGVYLNRLKKPMRLESDPTTVYAAILDHRYNGVIHRSDLDSKNPYNTYRRDGLPPGPIANPGAEALKAALHPAITSFLYFVAKPEGGGHRFSATLDEHNKAVQEYRRAQVRKAR